MWSTGDDEKAPRFPGSKKAQPGFDFVLTAFDKRLIVFFFCCRHSSYWRNSKFWCALMDCFLQVDDYSFCDLHPLPRQSLFASPSLSTAVPLYSSTDLSYFYYYRGGTGEPRIFLGAAVSHLEGTETSQRAAVWESTGPPPCSRGGIWLYPDEHNQF